MMKKLLLLSAAIFAFNLGAMAQHGVSTPTVVTDTLNFFINKQMFKYGLNLTTTNAPVYKAPASTATNAAHYVTHLGSIFRNKDTNLTVNGLEGWVSKNAVNASFTQSLSVHLYLCNIDPATDMPILPAIDSVQTSVNNLCPGGVCPAQFVGGNFFLLSPNGAPVGNPRQVKGDFAVLVRNYSAHVGDTVHVFRTSTATHTSYPIPLEFQTGEGLGVIRQNGVWHKTTNYTSATGFGGVGTDYEFLLAPRVTFTLQVSQIRPAKADSACIFDSLCFLNTSSPEFTNKQFNMNEFYRQYAPFINGPADGFFPDSVMMINFDDDHRLDTVPHLWGRVQKRFLPPGATSICKNYDTVGAFVNCYQLGKYRKMTGSYSTRVEGRDTFPVFVYYCGNIYDGIKSAGTLKNVNVFPNPAINGKVTITGLQGKNTIVVNNILGQVILAETSEKEEVIVDLLKQPAGSYTIRITSADNRTKVVKLINYKE